MTAAYARNLRWRQRNPHLRYAQSRRYHERHSGYDVNSGVKYTRQQEIMIRRKAGFTDPQIALLMGRSIKAIQSKRYKLVHG